MKPNRTMGKHHPQIVQLRGIASLGQLLLYCLIGSAGNAQIIPDRSLGDERSQIRTEGNRDRIEGGAVRGGNLFHSFEQFNVGESQSVYFNNPAGIERIFSRVTGTNSSKILGTLGVLGDADLFLLNPNGFLFGNRAQLDLRGSFFALTGDRILFETDRFSASEPDLPSLLTVSVPTGLQMGATVGAIEYAGENQINSAGLQVQPGETLGLVGGNIALSDSRLTAPSGRIELGSLAANQQLQFALTGQGYRLEYPAGQQFQDIQLNRVQMTLDSIDSLSGETTLPNDLPNDRTMNLPAGSLQVQGRQVAIANTLIQAQSGVSAMGQSGDLSFRATDMQVQQSQIRTATQGAAGGAAGGSVAIATDRLGLQNSGIETTTSGTGTGGNITIQVPNFILEAGSILRGRSLGNGNSGKVELNVNQLEVRDGSQVATISSGRGSAGTVQVSAGDRVVISGVNPNVQPSSADSAASDRASTLASRSNSSGNAGAVIVDAPLVTVENGAVVEVRSTGSGNAGNLEIRANEIQLLDGRLGSETNSGTAGQLILSARDGFQSRNQPVITASTRSGTGGTIFLVGDNIRLEGGLQIVSRAAREGTAGDIIVRTNQFTVRDNVQMTVGSQGRGASGRLDINAGKIDISNSVLSAETEFGTQGNITLRSRSTIQLRDRATISASTVGGRGGRIQLFAPNAVELSGNSEIRSQATGNGRAGEIRVESDRVNLRQNVQVTVDSQGSGAAGNLRIEANQIRLNRSSLNAETQSGPGGELRLLSGGNLLLRNGSTISASTQTGIAGQIVLTALEGIQLDGRSRILSGTRGNGRAGGIQILSERFIVRSGSEVEVSSQNQGNAGSIQVDARMITLDRGRLNAATRAGDRGNIRLFASDGLILTNRSTIDTNAQSRATGGNIEVDADFLLMLQDSDITAQAEQGRGGRIELEINNRFADPNSNISAAAASAFGEDGTVTVTAPNVDARSALIELPVQTPIDPSDLITVGCPTDEDANFSIGGRGGLPADPRQMLQGNTVVQDWREGFSARGLDTGSATSDPVPHHSIGRSPDQMLHPIIDQITDQITEAQGLQLNPLGQPELVAYSRSDRPRLAQTYCGGSAVYQGRSQ